jgi:hypothetical protein
MESRHKDELLAALEEALGRGWVLLGWWKVYGWYGIKKLRKEPYRDMLANWEAVAGKGKPLSVVNTREGLLLIGGAVHDFKSWT